MLNAAHDRIAETRAAAELVRNEVAATKNGRSDGRFADEMTYALAERDRQAAEVQREADQRLALLETVDAEANDRLRIMEELTHEIERLTAEIGALRRDQESLVAENAELQKAAAERLALLEANEAAYSEFKTILRGRLAEVRDMLG